MRIIAAPTTSLPETIGGIRNWDYRFVWLRDAAFTLAALDAVGHDREADAFMRFLKKVCRHEGGGHLQIMYGIDGRRDLVERQLDHLSGYRGLTARSGWATARSGSSSSTCTARSSRPPTSGAATTR